MFTYFKGKRTYVVAFLMFVAALLKAMGLMDTSLYEAIMGLLAALGFGALRAGVERVTAEIQGVQKKL